MWKWKDMIQRYLYRTLNIVRVRKDFKGIFAPQRNTLRLLMSLRSWRKRPEFARVNKFHHSLSNVARNLLETLRPQYPNKSLQEVPRNLIPKKMFWLLKPLGNFSRSHIFSNKPMSHLCAKKSFGFHWD